MQLMTTSGTVATAIPEVAVGVTRGTTSVRQTTTEERTEGTDTGRQVMIYAHQKSRRTKSFENQ